MKKILIIAPPLLLILFWIFPTKKDTPNQEDKISIKVSSIGKEKPHKDIPQKADTTENKIHREKEVEEILEATNLWEDLKSIDGLMENRLDMAREILPPEEYEKLEKIIQENFSGAKFAELVKNHLAQNLTDEDLSELKKLTEDPFLKKVWEMQGKASSIEGEKEMAEFAKEFKPSPEREKIMKEYEEQAQSTSKMLDLNKEFIMGMVSGSSTKQLTNDKLENLSQEITEKIKPFLEKEVLQRLYYSYQDLSDQELITLKQIDKNTTLTKTEMLIHEKVRELMFQGGKEVGKLHKGSKI
jgi:hypothetical protein